jgi:hypothetical protein
MSHGMENVSWNYLKGKGWEGIWSWHSDSQQSGPKGTSIYSFPILKISQQHTQASHFESYHDSILIFIDFLLQDVTPKSITN